MDGYPSDPTAAAKDDPNHFERVTRFDAMLWRIAVGDWACFLFRQARGACTLPKPHCSAMRSKDRREPARRLRARSMRNSVWCWWMVSPVSVKKTRCRCRVLRWASLANAAVLKRRDRFLDRVSCMSCTNPLQWER